MNSEHTAERLKSPRPQQRFWQNVECSFMSDVDLTAEAAGHHQALR